MTETFTQGYPHLITDVTTTAATVFDSELLESIQKSLAARGHKPREHLVDAGYTQSDTMLRSLNQRSIEVIGPMRSGQGWQAHEPGAFVIQNFSIDFEKKKAVCPMGAVRQYWRYNKREKTYLINFFAKDCSRCPVRAKCTKGEEGRPRQICVKTKPTFEYMQQQREFQKTEEFWRRYAPRAGIESTIGQAVNNTRLRRASYTGLAKTTFEHLFIAAGINFLRLGRWLFGEKLSQTRRSRFQNLMAIA